MAMPTPPDLIGVHAKLDWAKPAPQAAHDEVLAFGPGFFEPEWRSMNSTTPTRCTSNLVPVDVPGRS
jgi:hypothetical protein